MRKTFPPNHPWHPDQITTEKLSLLYKRVEEEVNELFDRDEDGDLPVEVQLVDRTRHESQAGIIPVPYMNQVETIEDFDAVLGALLSNLGRTTRDIEKLLQIRKSTEFKAPKVEDSGEKLRAAICKSLGGSSTATDEQIFHNIEKLKEMANKPPKTVETVVEKKLIPTIHSVHDLIIGDIVLILPTIDRTVCVGQVIDIVEAGRQLTDQEIVKWLGSGPDVGSKQWLRMKKAVSYERFVVKKDNQSSYLLVPRIPDQVKQVLAVLRYDAH